MVHLNGISTGFYVVEYDDAMFKLLTAALSKNDESSSNGTKGATKQLSDSFKACTNGISYPL